MPARHERAWVLAGTLSLLLAWKLASLAIGKDIILPPPEEVLARGLELFASPHFLAAFAGTLVRGLAAFALSMLSGALVGAASGASPRFAAFVAPLLSTIRAVPVLALILLALIWFGSDLVPVFSAFLMAFPIVVGQVAEGWRSADARLLEMARLFSLAPRRILFAVRLPMMAGYLAASAQAALGLCWKVVIAGEVLSQPAAALGSGMQDARLSLDTSGVFAWAGAGIALCALSDGLFRIARRALAHRGL